jgi:hypothetical protein
MPECESLTCRGQLRNNPADRRSDLGVTVPTNVGSRKLFLENGVCGKVTANGDFTDNVTLRAIAGQRRDVRSDR